MAIQIAGVKLSSLSIGTNDEGKEKISATYKLLTSDGRAIGSSETLTNQSEYGETMFVPAADTVIALKAAAALYKRDVEGHIGLTTT